MTGKNNSFVSRLKSEITDTCWLALHQCVVRILDCWESLTKFFRIAVFEDKLKSAKIILN